MNNIITILGFIILTGIIVYLQNKNYKKISGEISKIKLEKTDLTPVLNKIDNLKIPNVNLDEININIDKNAQQILEEIKKIDVGNIEIKDGKFKGDVYVEGDIKVNGNVSAFVEEGDV